MMERTSTERRAKGPAAARRDEPARQTRDVQQRLRKLTSQLEALHGDFEGLSTQAQATQGAVSELRLVEARQEIRAVQRRLDGLTSQIERVERGIEAVVARNEASTVTLATALEAVSARVQGVAGQMEGLNARIGDVERATEGLEAQGATSQQTLESIGEVRREVRMLKSGLNQVSTMGRELAPIRQAIAELEPPRRKRRERKGTFTRRLRLLIRPFRRAGRRVKRRIRVTRRKVGRAFRRTRVRTVRLLRQARAKVRRGLRRVRQKLVGAYLGRLDHHSPRELRIPKRYRRSIELADPPVISIVTPSLNQGGFVGETIRSVLDQGYPRLEYIVQDGGSTDETPQILERYRGELHRCQVEPDNGQADAINRGFTHATGEIMAYLNADDLILPGALAYVARYFERHPEVDVVYGHRVLVDEDGREVGRWVLPRHNDAVLSWADFVPQETLYWRRRIWDGAGVRMDEDSQFALDWDLILRFRDANARIVRLPRFLGAFRIHGEQKTSAEMDTAGRREMDMIRSREHGREVEREEVRRHIRGYLLRHVVLHRLYRARLLRY